MAHRRIRRLVRAGLLGGVAVLTSGCLGLGTAGGFVPTGKLAGPLADVKPLDGATIAVGSKSFTEQIILGKMAIILLQSAGAEVTDLTGIPGSASARAAIKDGQVQAQWEYTGTGWLAFLGHDKPIRDSEEQYVAVRDEDAEKNDLIWLPPSPMNNTYAFAVTDKVQKEFNITKLSQLKDVPKEQRTFCLESELLNRPDDGMPGMLKMYGIPKGTGVPVNQLKIFQTGAVYDATAKGVCNFGEVFTTDGRILSLNLNVLEDDKDFFAKANVSMVLRGPTLKEHPQLEELFAPVTKELTDEAMLRLNGKVDVSGDDPATVAFNWLKSEGFVEDR